MWTNKLARLGHCVHGSSLTRSISASSVNLLRKMVIEEKDNVTVVRGVEVESDRKQSLMIPAEKSQACPLCRLNLKNLRYTDILITGQFLGENKKIMAQEDTKLCNRQYRLVSRLIYNAQVCSLLPRPDDWPEAGGTYDKLNSYYMYPYKRRDDLWAWVQEKYWRTEKYT